MRMIPHFPTSAIKAYRYADVFDPSLGSVQARVPLGCADTVDAAVQVAAKAQPGWAAMNPQRRARILFRFKELVERDMNLLAAMISAEHGKVLADSRGDVQRGLEVIEFACGIPHLLKGEYSPAAGPGIDVLSAREPLGVVAGITPFNFPAMIPMWMFGPAIAAGNSFILKPSERAPSAPVHLAQLMLEAGAPSGVLQVVHGDKVAVDAILAHRTIQAVSFVGSSDIAEYVYAQGAANGKRVQAMGGAKNHAVVLPDADIDRAVTDLMGAAFGSAGERCMAMPVIVAVGEVVANELRHKLVKAIKKIHVGLPTDDNADYGPVVSAAHKARIEQWIDTAQQEGAEVVIDGRGFSLPGYEGGYFMGPTFLDHVTAGMGSYREEIFGPVLQLMRVSSAAEAVELPSKHQYGNGVAIFTRSGRSARDFAAQVKVGMVGVNVPIPVPVGYHSFGGWKRSAYGDHNQYGPEGLRFWTRVKTVTQRWPDDNADAANVFVIPVMG
jgi:malonate-semialdehyde dehydrogenase (acetylating) / methylmalonate-semialdehyde dehydrogenase